MEVRKLTLNKLIGMEVSATQFEVLRFPIGTNVQQQAVANVTVRVEGSADVYYGKEAEPGKTLNAGTCSIEGDWARISTYDEFRLKVMTPTLRYYCIRDYKNRFLNPAVLRGSAGNAVTVPSNKNIFIAMGSVAVGGVEVSAPGQFFTSDGATDIQVLADVLMIQFDRAE